MWDHSNRSEVRLQEALLEASTHSLWEGLRGRKEEMQGRNQAGGVGRGCSKQKGVRYGCRERPESSVAASRRPGGCAGGWQAGRPQGPSSLGKMKGTPFDFVLCQSGAAFRFLASCHIAPRRKLAAMVLLTLCSRWESLCLADGLESGIWNA